MSWEDQGGRNEGILVVLYLLLLSRGEAGGIGVRVKLPWKNAIRDGVER